MSLLGRIYNRIYSVTPESIQEIYRQGTIKLHRIDHSLLQKNAEVIKVPLEESLPAADRIALSYTDHKSQPLRELQQNYNQSVQHLRVLKREMNSIDAKKQRAQKLLQKNPHQHVTQKTTLAMLDHGLAQKQAQHNEITGQFFTHQENYYRGLHQPILRPTQPNLPDHSTAIDSSHQDTSESYFDAADELLTSSPDSPTQPIVSHQTVSHESTLHEIATSLPMSASLTQVTPLDHTGSQAVPSVQRAVVGNKLTRWLKTRRPASHHHALTTIYEPLGDSADVVGMGNAGEPGVHLPSNPVGLGANIPTDYIGGAVAISSMETFFSFRKEEKRLSESLHHVGEIKELTGKRPELDFLDRFLRQERKTVRFCKYIPGLSSGTSGALTVVGQYVGAVSPVGLFLSAANGVAHVGDNARQYHYNAQARSALKAEHATNPQESHEIELRHLQNERKLLLKSSLAWGGVAAGATTLGAASGAAIGLGVAHAAPVLLPVGIAVTTPSIVGATVWNNMIYGKRFTPGLSAHLQEQIQQLRTAARAENHEEVERLFKALPNKDSLEQELLKSETKRTVTKDFRGQAFSTMKPSAVLQQKTRNVLQHVVASASLGLLENSVANMRKTTHEKVSKAVQVDHAQQLAALRKLSSVPHSIDDASLAHNQLSALLHTLEQSDAKVMVARLVAARIVREEVEAPRLLSFTKKASAEKLVYHQNYDWLRKLDASSGSQTSAPAPTLGELLARVLNRSRETSSAADAVALLQRFDRLQKGPNSDVSGPPPQKQTKIHSLFKTATNEYLLFQARDEAKIQRGAATRMSTAWRQTLHRY